MYQSVLTNHNFTIPQVKRLYQDKLNKIGTAVLNKQRYGITRKIDRLDFIKLKNLLPVISADIVTIPVNQLYTMLNNK